jgi:hypothetical protein
MRTIQEDFREFAHLDRKRRGDGLSPRQLHRWEVLRARLDDAFGSRPPEGRTERRRSLRVPTRLRVICGAAAGPDGTVVNLSRTGCFVRTGTPAPLGAELTLLLEPGPGAPALEVEAQVVSGGPSERGMGLRFRTPPPDLRKRLDDLYEALEADAGASAGGAS